MKKGMQWYHWAAFVAIIVGALNWLSVLFGRNMVAWLFDASVVSQAIYLIIGVAGIYSIYGLYEAKLKMPWYEWLAVWFVIVGAVNWGFVALGFNLVDALFGAQSIASKMTYLLVGLSATYSIYVVWKAHWKMR